MTLLSKLEQIRAKLFYAVMVGHDFIPVSRLMLFINRISRLLGHERPLDYTPPSPEDTPQHKVWLALDQAHQELFDLVSSRRQELTQKFGQETLAYLNNNLAELSMAKDKAFDKEHGPGASLLKRGRKFAQL